MFKNKKVLVGTVLALLVAASSWAVDFYAGANLGYGHRTYWWGVSTARIPGFSMTPYVGILPGPEKSFALQLDLPMYTGHFAFSPEVYAIWNFVKVPYVKPYFGVGVGLNLEEKFAYTNERGNTTRHGGDLFSLGARLGANYNIPNTNIDIDVDFKIKHMLLLTTEFDICAGVRYRFVKK